MDDVTDISYLSFRRVVRRHFWTRPRLYQWIGLLRGRGNVLEAGYDIAIDGFPRSGNTYTWQMLRATQEDKLKVKVHLHLPTILINAIVINKPACLTIRHPVDAVASRIIYFGGKGPIEPELEQYIDFYTVLLPYRTKLLVLPFDAITRDFKIALQLMNHRFGLKLTIPHDLDACQQSAFARIDDIWRDASGKVDEMKVGRPNAHRQALSAAKKEQIRAPRYAPLLKECDRLYAIYQDDFVRELANFEKKSRPKQTSEPQD